MDTLRVATFNTHWGVTLAGRPFDVVGAAVALDADVLVLQESWRPHGAPGYAATIARLLDGTLHELPMMSDRNPARPQHLPLPPGPVGDCGLAVVTQGSPSGENPAVAPTPARVASLMRVGAVSRIRATDGDFNGVRAAVAPTTGAACGCRHAALKS